MSISNVFIMGGKPEITFEMTSSDAVQTITSSKHFVTGSNVNDKPAHTAAITIETAEIRYAFGVDPVQGGLGHLDGISGVIKLQSYKSIRDFRFISNASGVHATLMITIGS